MKMGRPLIALAAILSGCTPPPTGVPSLPPGADSFIGNPAVPELALLEYVLADYFGQARSGSATVCAAQAGGEGRLSEDAELALMKRFPELAPFERCLWQDNRYVDAITGDNARVYNVDELACPTPRRCTARAGFTAANSGAEYNEFRLSFDDGRWRIERGEVSVMS